MVKLCIKLIATKVGINIVESEIAHVEIKYLSGNESAFTKSIFARFSELDLRRKIWENKKRAENVKLFMEEWLTDSRAKIMKKCKRLLSERIIEDVKTDDGNLIVLYRDQSCLGLRSKVTNSPEELQELLTTLNMTRERTCLDPEHLLGTKD